MKKKSQNDADIAGMMAKIQAQLAVLDRKLDAFMTKSLTELAQAKVAAQKPSHPMPAVQQSAPRPTEARPARQMFAVICFDCGKDTEIPFKPSGDRPVYCKECFAKRRAGNGPKSGDAKPQMVSIAPSVNPAPVAVAPPASKKKPVVAKKPAAKKKAVAKKAAKRK